MHRTAGRVLQGLLLAALATGCTTAQKKSLISTAIEDEGQRKQALEATIRVFDENPEYVDEMFKLMINHKTSLNRFLTVSASGLDDPQFAALMARHLVKEPKSLAEVFVQLLEASKDAPEARKAMAGAMMQRPGLVADTVLARPEALVPTMVAIVDALGRHPEAQGAFLQAMRERKDRISALLLSDKETLAAVMAAMARQGVKDNGFAQELRELFGAKDDRTQGGSGGAPPPAPKK
ncbi:hypothetical protein FGE12_08335 [Aggregicoccus sp. 17bor-14]|uniref:hypothetical protein n=1 Tax=Myxococcaceae TaxID=31 RepID=UPI00129D1750|nr:MULTISPECIES: hypothetical protein [Myxococcaceae]MBF5042405.1 hypothetical protein [Simulacricoccus sp. 17bor-14]MRI88177.1 hypothetical protein [Aggregicoccus sp. 17bor-14]